LIDYDSPKGNGKSTKLPQKPKARRASNSPQFYKPSVDWSRARGTSSSFLPFGLFGGSKGTYEPITPMDPTQGFSSPYSDEKNYIELDMDEDLRVGEKPRRRSTNTISSFVSIHHSIPFRRSRRTNLTRYGSIHRVEQFEGFTNTPRHNFKIQRSRRAAERIGMATIVTCLLVFLLVRHGNKPGTFVEKAKFKALGRPNVRSNGFLSLAQSRSLTLPSPRPKPLRSNIPLHSYRANLKQNPGYVTTFPYGGLSEFLLPFCSIPYLFRTPT